MIKRLITIGHPSMNGMTPEAVQTAKDICEGMLAIGQSMIPAMVDEARQRGQAVDEDEAHKIAMGFEVKIMKVEE